MTNPQTGLLPSVPAQIGGLSVKPRWDKYDPYVGNFRATLAVDATLDQANLVLAVGLNSDGACVIGAGQSGIAGLIIMPVGIDIHGYLLEPPLAGQVVDVGKHGEITNFIPTVFANSKFSWDTSPATAATKYYAHPNGTVTATAGAGSVYVGHTVEPDRLIVNVVEDTPA